MKYNPKKIVPLKLFVKPEEAKQIPALMQPKPLSEFDQAWMQAAWERYAGISSDHVGDHLSLSE